MAEKTAISWCDHTFNLWIGCWKIAPECKFCYAEAFAHRFEKRWGKLWERTGPRDWAEVHPDPEINRQLDAYRGRLFALIAELDSLDWMLLSKRVDDIERALPWARRGCELDTDGDGNCPLHLRGCPEREPFSNVWLGVTAGTRDTLRYNAPRLRAIPAAGHFISCEPLLEDIPREDWDDALDPCARCGEDRIDLVIVGDESGHHRRPANLDAVRVARDACDAHGVGFHFKQWHEDDKLVHLPILDGEQHTERM